MKNTNKKGFTLVELLVVIAILAILATVAVVGYTSFTKKAEISADQQAVVQMNKVLEADKTLNGVPADVDAVKALLIANDYNGALTTYYSGYQLAWLKSDNVIVLVEKDAIVYPEDYAGKTGYELLTRLATDAGSLTGGLKDGETLHVNANINADGGLSLDAAGEYVVNLNGNTINSSDYVGSWVDGGKLVVSNGIIDATASGQKISVYADEGGYVELNNVQVYSAATANPLQCYGGTMVLNNVTTAQHGVADTSWYNSAVMVVNNVHQVDGVWTIYGEQAHTTINSGMYSGDKAVMMCAPGGTVIINGGTFVGHTAAVQADYNPNYANQGALYVVEINGGTFNGNIKIATGVTCTVNGGTFSVNIAEVANVIIGEGKTVVDNGNGTWTVQ